MPGFEDFNPATEVLRNDKPGTGFKDAPRCFSLKLKKATQDDFEAKPCSIDDQLLIKHDSQKKLIFIATVHVDDIEVACENHILDKFIAVLKRLFGDTELDITHGSFINCE